MKKVILLLFLLNVSFINAQVKLLELTSSKSLDLKKNDSGKSDNSFSHQSISLGGGFFYVNDKGARILPLISFSTTFQLSKKFLIELKYDNCVGKYRETDRKHTYIYSVFPETSFNISESKVKLYPGIGFGLLSINGGLSFNLMGITKIEYNFNKWFSVNSEFMMLTNWQSGKNEGDAYPIMLKLNSNFKLPY
jgi:hypothetical protein